MFFLASSFSLYNTFQWLYKGASLELSQIYTMELFCKDSK